MWVNRRVCFHHSCLTEAGRCRQSALGHKWSLVSDNEIPADEVDTKQDEINNLQKLNTLNQKVERWRSNKHSPESDLLTAGLFFSFIVWI